MMGIILTCFSATSSLHSLAGLVVHLSVTPGIFPLQVTPLPGAGFYANRLSCARIQVCNIRKIYSQAAHGRVGPGIEYRVNPVGIQDNF